MQALTIHRGYQCCRSGACCTAGWTIPVEVDVVAQLAESARAGRLRLPPASVPALLPHAGPPGEYAAWLGTDDEGHCVFFEPAGRAGPAHAGAAACGLQRQLGPGAMPHACRQFPRVAVLRPSSVAVSLSHYCPTAASMLFRDDVPLAVEAGPPAPPGGPPYEGLDARSAFPPLVRADLLFSWEAFERWEGFVIGCLADDRPTVEDTLGTIGAAAEGIRGWSPAHGPFEAWVERWLDAEAAPLTLRAAMPGRAADAYAAAAAAVPSGIRVSPAVDDVAREWQRTMAPRWAGVAAAVRRYLAARAWASWIGHDGGGIRSFVRWLAIVLGVLRVEILRGLRAGEPSDAHGLLEAIRRADLLLVHLLTPLTLARRLARLETLPLSEPELLPQ